MANVHWNSTGPPYLGQHDVREARQIGDAPNANPRGDSGCSQCSHANLAHHLFSTLLTGTRWICLDDERVYSNYPDYPPVVAADLIQFTFFLWLSFL